MNNFVAIGRLTKDPEMRYSNGNKAVGSFTIAIGRKYKKDGDPDADFFKCVCFGKTAEFVDKYFKKGQRVVIQGEVQNDNYKNKDGNMVYGTKILVNQVEFGDSKSDAGEPSHTTTETPKAGNDGFMHIPDGLADELPFQ